MPSQSLFAVYWPGITNDITHFVSQCEACQKHQKRTQKEPLLQPELPCRPWERLSSDLLECKGHQYLQSTPDNSNLQGKSKKVRVIGS